MTAPLANIHSASTQWTLGGIGTGLADPTHDPTHGSRGGSRIFHGGWPNPKNGFNWPPWPLYGPQFSPSTGHIGTLGPIFVSMGPILGHN